MKLQRSYLAYLLAMFFVSLRLLNVNSKLSVPCAIVLPIVNSLAKDRCALLHLDFPSRLKHSSTGPCSAVMKPEVGEVPMSPAWSLMGQHGHLQVCSLGWVCGGGHSLGEQEARCLSAADVPSPSCARILSL